MLHTSERWTLKNPPHAVQKAKELFTFLENQALAKGWGPHERAAAFHGEAHPQCSPSPEHPWWPRVFVLTQYNQQVLPCAGALAR